MRFIIPGLIRILDLLVMLGLLIVLSVGVFSIWMDVLNKPSLIYHGLTLLVLSLLIWQTGRGLNLLLRRKLVFASTREYWQPQKALRHTQVDETRINPCLTLMMYLLPVYCFLPIFYSILYPVIFWTVVLILICTSLFCFSQMREGFVHTHWQATYYPRTQAFIDFYLVTQDEWTEKQEKLFQKIDSSSTDFIVAQQLRALIRDEEKHPVAIDHHYIDVTYGPGFDATPENLAAASQVHFDSFDAMLKTPEHLG